MASYDERIPSEEVEFEEGLEDLYASRNPCPSFLCSRCPLPNPGRAAGWSRLRADCREKWWEKRCKRTKEVLLEAVVGAKWRALVQKIKFQKNLLRRRKPLYGYDPMSYALNFDERNDHGEEASKHLNFLERLAARTGECRAS